VYPAFRAMTGQFQEEMLDKIFHTIDKNEKDVPKKYWMILEPEHEKAYQEALTSNTYSANQRWRV
jgi:hypothetical protein